MTPTRYPLQWPAGWKRTDYSDRREAKFGKARYKQGDRWVSARALTVSEACERVLAELVRMGVDRNDIVISTNVETRLDGLSRSDRPAPHDVGVCVYWQQGKAPMRCMAIDQYDRVADNLAAVAATLEAMRAIERHGGAAILDRAFTGFTALPAPIVAGMKRPWRDVLGFPTEATVNESMIAARYRQLVAVHHEAKGGDPVKMAELNVARDEALKEIP